jgi:chemotaxis protein CheX
VNRAHVQPFIEEAIHTFEAMVGVAPTNLGECEKLGAASDSDVAGVVVISGAAAGRLVIGMPKDTAVKAVSRILAESLTDLTPDVLDGVGEMANVICARAKSVLSRRGLSGLVLTLPRVVAGRDSPVWASDDLPAVSTTFDAAGIGRFRIDVAFRRG